MLLPPGQILHKDLSTSFTNFEELLLDLRDNRFSGYLRLNFWEFEGVLVLDNGKIIQASVSEKENLVMGETAVAEILEKSDNKDGTIDVHRLQNEVALALSSVIGATFYKSGEELGGNNLARIFRQLGTEEITGYVNLQFGDKKGSGTVYLLEGIPVESVIISNSGRVLHGEAVFRKILEVGHLISEQIKIYQNHEMDHLKEETGFIFPKEYSPVVEFWSIFFQIVPPEIDKIIKRNVFWDFWQDARRKYARYFRELTADPPFLEWSEGKLVVHKICQIEKVNEGFIRCSADVITKLPDRKRKKINVAKILDTLQKKYALLPQNDLFQDPVLIIRKIFRDIQ